MVHSAPDNLGAFLRCAVSVRPPHLSIGDGYVLSKRQQFVDAAVGPERQFFQGVFQPRRRFDAVQFGGGKEALDGSGALGGAFAAGEQPVLSIIESFL